MVLNCFGRLLASDRFGTGFDVAREDQQSLVGADSFNQTELFQGSFYGEEGALSNGEKTTIFPSRGGK